MTKQLLWAVVIVVVLGGAYWWWQGSNGTVAPNSESEVMTNNTNIPSGAQMEDGVIPEGPNANVPLSATVSYTGSAFSPATVTIRKGGMVTWSNNGSSPLWVASAQHPTHTVYAGDSLEEHCPDNAADSFDQCAGGNSYSFIFNKTGTWRYHDDMNSTAFGSVVVVE